MIEPTLLTFTLIFISGVLTILAPSIWPLLPLILSGSVNDGHQRPLGVVAGVMISLMLFALLISSIVQHYHINPNLFRIFSVTSLLLISACLYFPSLNEAIQSTIRRAGMWTERNDIEQDNGVIGSVITGLILGLVWAPFAGPILETVAKITDQYSLGSMVLLAIIIYALGVALPLLVAAYWAGKLIRRLSQQQRSARGMELIFGTTTLLSALAMLTNLDSWIINTVMSWF